MPSGTKRPRKRNPQTASPSTPSSSLPESPVAASPLVGSPSLGGVLHDMLFEQGAEMERASPSKYPTPLPEDEDEDEERDALPIRMRAFEAPPLVATLSAATDVRHPRREIDLGREETDGVSLIDMDKVEVEEMRKTADSHSAVTSNGAIPARRTVATSQPVQRSSKPDNQTLYNSSRMASIPSPAFPPSQPAGHVRSAEPPRIPSSSAAPRALSALSATLRAVQAATSTATAYATSTHAHANTGASMPGPMYSPLPPQWIGGFSDHIYPGVTETMRRPSDEEDRVLNATWADVMFPGNSEGTRLLTLVFEEGVQIWDVTDVADGSGVREVLNLDLSLCPLGAADGEGAMSGPVTSAVVLPPMASSGGQIDLAILTSHSLYLYDVISGVLTASYVFPSPAQATLSDWHDMDFTYGSPTRRELHVASQRIGTPVRFEVGRKGIVVSTNYPTGLVILSRPSLELLLVVPEADLVIPRAPPSSTSANRRASVASSTSPGSPIIYSSRRSSHYSGSPPAPEISSSSPPAQQPIFAMNERLLAFLAPVPATMSSPPLHVAGVDPPPALETLEKWGRSIGRFFSRSAPAAAGVVGALVGSPSSTASSAASDHEPVEENGCIRVLDLRHLFAGTEANATREVHVFHPGRAAVGKLAFTGDGTELIAVRRDGLGATVWGLRSNPTAPANYSTSPAHLYTLHRGRTAAYVESISPASDGRYIALTTKRRTIHVFAVNPGGGQVSGIGHVHGRGTMMGDSSADGLGLHALVRMKLPPPRKVTSETVHEEVHLLTGTASTPPPLAVTFLPQKSSPGRTSPHSPSPPFRNQPLHGTQDMLVFDPLDGVLSLRRITTSLEPHLGGIDIGLGSMKVPVPVSVSLPAARALGLSSATSVSASPPLPIQSFGSPGSYASSHHQHSASAGSDLGELVGKEMIVATWRLGRKRGWDEVRSAERLLKSGSIEAGKQDDWLAQAELSTCQYTRPIYLAHQFSFYRLGEDYHALIRRYQLGIRGKRIQMRRPIEVSAVASGGGGEAFVEGFGYDLPTNVEKRLRTERRQTSASFDEPLASALSGSTPYSLPTQPILPMLPNGDGRRRGIPIRAVTHGLGDGVAGGLGRLRREMRTQTRVSPPAAQYNEDMLSVPLEFDDEDEDFAVPEDDPSHLQSEDLSNVSTPSTAMAEVEEAEDLQKVQEDESAFGWNAEDAQAVEEAERFDTISVKGFLEEGEIDAAATIVLPKRKKKAKK
ncbi:unnamed protein product [Mycena citricolor]|uniref:BCAS3 WD40 domain-containing protein n=1 Tax=Mycena citricolor TaxID=2018698 RepID=A0AAD2HRM8_9AGAR|nr:unnamed protein product [Mycena citricolor]